MQPISDKGSMDLPLPEQAPHGVIGQKWALHTHQTQSSFKEAARGLTKHKKYTKKHAAPVVRLISVCVGTKCHEDDTNRGL